MLRTGSELNRMSRGIWGAGYDLEEVEPEAGDGSVDKDLMIVVGVVVDKKGIPPSLVLVGWRRSWFG